jgi:hypothetical protein
LKKIKFLGFGGLGLQIHVLKEHSCPASVLEGEGGVYNIFAHGRFEILGKCPKTPKATCFWVRLMDFWPESPASGVEKWISGFFRASGHRKFTFLHPRPESSSSVRESALPTLFTSRTPLTITVLLQDPIDTRGTGGHAGGNTARRDTKGTGGHC